MDRNKEETTRQLRLALGQAANHSIACLFAVEHDRNVTVGDLAFQAMGRLLKAQVLVGGNVDTVLKRLSANAQSFIEAED